MAVDETLESRLSPLRRKLIVTWHLVLRRSFGEIPVPGLTTDDLPVVQLYRRSRTTAAPISPPFDAFNPDPKKYSSHLLIRENFFPSRSSGP